MPLMQSLVTRWRLVGQQVTKVLRCRTVNRLYVPLNLRGASTDGFIVDSFLTLQDSVDACET